MFQEKLKVSLKKTLKLTNVLYRELINVDLEKIEKEVELMDNYIKTKGANPIGPLIQRIDTIITEENAINIQVTLYSNVINILTVLILGININQYIELIIVCM